MTIAKVEADDIIFICSGEIDSVNLSMNFFRNKLGKDFNLYTIDWAPVWVKDFPMFKLHNGSLSSFHHPFTAPKTNNLENLNGSDLLDLNSLAFDIVINGYELGGGSVRIHKSNIQEIIFRILGMNDQDIKNNFGYLFINGDRDI